MFEKLKSLLSASEADAPASGEKSHAVAAACLMIEAAQLDGTFDPVERKRIADLLVERFDLGQDEAAAVFETAEARQAESVEIFSFTNEIKNAFDENKRVEMIEMLWEVVYSDKVLHAYEANLLRRMAGLLHVTDRQCGEAKKRVMDRLGL